MMLIVLDKSPYTAAVKLPKAYRHKQLLELMQMISCIVDFGYKQLPTGKAIKKWIEKNIGWVCLYACNLMTFVNISEETRIKYQCLLDLLRLKEHVVGVNIDTLVFRYVKEYAGNTKYKTDSEIDADEAVREYKKYVEWKGLEVGKV